MMRDKRHTSRRSGLYNWHAAVSAIMVRDIKTRFSGGSLGHAWAIIIPLSWIIAIVLFFNWLGRDAPIPVALPVFLVTGMLPYLVFRQTVTSMMRTLRSNRHLATIGPIEAEDIFTATALIEVANAALMCAVALAALALWTNDVLPQDLLTAIFGMALACGFGIALGRFTALMALISDSAMRLTPILLRPFFWVSGIFFVSSEIPGWLLNWLWYNPLFHAIEILRSGFFHGFESQFATPLVPIAAIAFFYFLSKIIEAGLASRPGIGVTPI